MIRNKTHNDSGTRLRETTARKFRTTRMFKVLERQYLKNALKIYKTVIQPAPIISRACSTPNGLNDNEDSWELFCPIFDRP
jgi:hypothetical protein